VEKIDKKLFHVLPLKKIHKTRQLRGALR
jgi:hypothetical protein